MRLAVILGLMLLAGCTSTPAPVPVAKPGYVDVTAEVVEFTPGALHEDYDGGGWAVFDATKLHILCPQKWQDADLTVYSQPGASNKAFHVAGSRWSFSIEEKYLVGKDETAGRTTEYQAFEGALEGLAETK